LYSKVAKPFFHFKVQRHIANFSKGTLPIFPNGTSPSFPMALRRKFPTVFHQLFRRHFVELFCHVRQLLPIFCGRVNPQWSSESTVILCFMSLRHHKFKYSKHPTSLLSLTSKYHCLNLVSLCKICKGVHARICFTQPNIFFKTQTVSHRLGSLFKQIYLQILFHKISKKKRDRAFRQTSLFVHFRTSQIIVDLKEKEKERKGDGHSLPLFPFISHLYSRSYQLAIPSPVLAIQP